MRDIESDYCEWTETEGGVDIRLVPDSPIALSVDSTDGGWLLSVIDGDTADLFFDEVYPTRAQAKAAGNAIADAGGSRTADRNAFESALMKDNLLGDDFGDDTYLSSEILSKDPLRTVVVRACPVCEGRFGVQVFFTGEGGLLDPTEDEDRAVGEIWKESPYEAGNWLMFPDVEHAAEATRAGLMALAQIYPLYRHLTCA